MADYRKSHLAPEKGEDYHASFSENRFRAMVWSMERRILERIAREYIPGGRISHLDVACGTGRILKHLSGLAAVSVGIDISPVMLEVARKQCPSSELIEGDITACPALENRRFNLITAFRFFPNAETELQRAAAAAVAAHLDRGGVFVFNNHRHLGSTRYRLARLLGRGGLEGMSRGEAEAVICGAGLVVERVFHLNVLPVSERHTLLPLGLLSVVEGALARFGWLRNLGENLIYVCRHAN